MIRAYKRAQSKAAPITGEPASNNQPMSQCVRVPAGTWRSVQAGSVPVEQTNLPCVYAKHANSNNARKTSQRDRSTVLQGSSEYQHPRANKVISAFGTLETREDSVISASSTLRTREDSSCYSFHPFPRGGSQELSHFRSWYPGDSVLRNDSDSRVNGLVPITGAVTLTTLCKFLSFLKG